MAEWVLTEERHREIVQVLREARVRDEVPPPLPLEVFKALPRAERCRHYYAGWNPMKSRYLTPAWTRLMAEVADGRWHQMNDLRRVLVDDHGMSWKQAAHLLFEGMMAGALEERRPGGSPRYVDRLYRFRKDCPSRLKIEASMG